MTTWRGYNGSVEYSDASTDMMLSAPRQAVLLAGGAAFRSTDGMSTTLTTPCVETTWRRNHHGYGYAMRRRHSPRHVLAHRLAWEDSFGPIPPGTHVLHRCDNRACINVDHLFLGTNGDNIADKVAKGRSLLNRPRGSLVAQSRLTEAMVVEMRHLNACGVSKHELARRYRVGRSTVIDAITGRQWSHVPAHSAERCAPCREVSRAA